MITFLFIMVMILAITVCASVLSGRVVSRDIKDLQDENKKPKLSMLDVHRAMEDRLGDFQRHVMLSVKNELEAVGHKIDKTDQAVRAIEKAMTHDKKVRYRADAEIAALNFSDYSSNKNLRIEIPPPPPAGGVRFNKGDLIRTPDGSGSYHYWKCHVSDKDLAVFGKITRHRISPYVLNVSYSANVMIVSNHMSDDRPDEYQRLDVIPEIG